MDSGQEYAFSESRPRPEPAIRPISAADHRFMDMQGDHTEIALNERTIVKIVGQAQSAHTQYTPDLANEHVCIAALVHGWAHISAHHELPDRWKTYRIIEESLAQTKDFATRLSMCLLFKIWRYRENPDRQNESVKRTVPSWLWSVESQETLPVDNIIQSMPWPGIRTEMLKDPTRWAANQEFWSNHIRHWRFAWPYDLEDTIDYSTVSNLYTFTPEFRRRMHDVRYWTYESDFFSNFPELDSLAPKFEPQLAVYRLRDKTAEQEGVIRRAREDQEVRAKLQAFEDSLENFREAHRRRTVAAS